MLKLLITDPENRALLATRKTLQDKIDAWFLDRRGNAFNQDEYIHFLKDIGYLVPEGDDFQITTDHVDDEMALMLEHNWLCQSLMHVLPSMLQMPAGVVFMMRFMERITIPGIRLLLPDLIRPREQVIATVRDHMDKVLPLDGAATTIPPIMLLCMIS